MGYGVQRQQLPAINSEECLRSRRVIGGEIACNDSREAPRRLWLKQCRLKEVEKSHCQPVTTSRMFLHTEHLQFVNIDAISMAWGVHSHSGALYA